MRPTLTPPLSSLPQTHIHPLYLEAIPKFQALSLAIQTSIFKTQAPEAPTRQEQLNRKAKVSPALAEADAMSLCIRV